jgi:hypothetical protein
MPQQRVQVDTTNERLTQLQPTASPTDALVHPAAPTQYVGDTELQALANGLKDIQPGLNKFLTDAQSINDQKEYEKGQAARANNAQAMVNWKDAVKAGVPLDKNPFFRKAWKESDGSVAADRFNSDLSIALATGDFTKSTNEDESATLFDNFRANWYKQNGLDSADPITQDAFTRKANAYEQTARQHQANLIGDRIVETQMNNMYQEGLGIFLDASQKKLPSSVIGSSLTQLANKMIATGADPKKVNGIILDTATSQALLDKSIDPFLALDSVATGSGFLGRTMEARERKQTIQNQIDSANLQAAAASWKKYEQDMTVGVNTGMAAVMSYATGQLQKGEPLNERDLLPVLTKLGTFGADGAHAVEFAHSLVTKMNSDKWTDDHDALTELTYDEITGASTDLKSNLMTYMLSGKVTPQTAGAYYERQRTRDAQDQDSFLKQKQLKDAMNAYEDKTFKPLLFDEIKGFFRAGLKDNEGMSLPQQRQYHAAVAEAFGLAQDYINQNAGKSSVNDDKAFAGNVLNIVLGRYQTINGNSVDKGGVPVNTRNVNVNGKPVAFNQPDFNLQTAPIAAKGDPAAVGHADKWAPTLQEYDAMIDDYVSAKGKGGDVSQTALGKKLVEAGVNLDDPAEVGAATKAQLGVLQHSAESAMAPPVTPQPVPPPTPKAGKASTASTPAPINKPPESTPGPHVITEAVIQQILHDNPHSKGKRQEIIDMLKKQGFTVEEPKQ